MLLSDLLLQLKIFDFGCEVDCFHQAALTFRSHCDKLEIFCSNCRLDSLLFDNL